MPTWADLAELRLEREIDHEASRSAQQVIRGDAREELSRLDADRFRLAVTSPPYWNILNKVPDHKVLAERVEHGLSTSYGEDVATSATSSCMTSSSTRWSDLRVGRAGHRPRWPPSDHRRRLPTQVDLLPIPCRPLSRATERGRRGFSRVSPFSSRTTSGSSPTGIRRTVRPQYPPSKHPHLPSVEEVSASALHPSEPLWETPAVDRTLNEAIAELRTFPYQGRPYAARNWGHSAPFALLIPKQDEARSRPLPCPAVHRTGGTRSRPIRGCGYGSVRGVLPGTNRPRWRPQPVRAPGLICQDTRPPSARLARPWSPSRRNSPTLLPLRADTGWVEEEIRAFFHEHTSRSRGCSGDFCRQANDGNDCSARFRGFARSSRQSAVCTQ